MSAVALGPTQHVQGALMVGDDDIGPLCLEVFPAAHVKAYAQEVLHMAHQGPDHPGGKDKSKNVSTHVLTGFCTLMNVMVGL